MPRPDARQRAALDALKKLDPNLTIEWDEDTGTPFLVRGLLSPPSPPVGAQSMADAAHGAAYAFLRQNKALYRLKDPDQEFPRSRVMSDESGSTVHLFQLYQGVEVFDGELSIALDKQNRVTQVLGRYRPNLRLSTEPAVSVEQAIEIARANLEFPDKDLVPITSRLLVVNTASFPDVVAKLGKKDVLSWRIELLTWVSFVDAHDGSVIFTYDNTQTARNRETYFTQNCRALPGMLWISETGAVPGQPVDDIAWAAHNNAGLVYDFYWDNFRLDSFDGRGHKMVSTVHSGVNTGFTCDHNNAAFYPSLLQVAYGDGDGTKFGPFAKAVDVVAHEWQHAVTYFSITWSDGSPRGLDYKDESGALNESYSDFFGNLVENKGWLLGEDCYTPKTTGDALRDMADPARYGQPDHYSKYVNTGTQSYKVHINSGIMNKCAYLMSEGGTHYGVTVRGIGKEAAMKIWFRALRHHLQGASGFKEARPAMLQACQELFPGEKAKYATVQNAFAAVGIGEPAPTPAIVVEPTNIDFGEVALGQSAQRTLTVRNTGSASLTISAIYSNNPAFSVAGDTTFQLAPNASKTINLNFSPTNTGQHQAALTIESNDAIQPTLAVTLFGTGLGVPRITIEPTNIDFGEVALGQSAQRTLTVRNTGSASLTISAIYSNNPAFSIAGDTAFQLAPNASKTINLKFTPTNTGQHQAALTIESNDAIQPALVVKLSGSGVKAPEITAEPGILDFGTITIGDSAELSVKISNIGGSRLAISEMKIDQPAFAVVGDAAFSLDPGTSKAIIIRFAPVVEERVQATLAITSNDPRWPVFPVTLIGIGKSVPVDTPHIVLEPRQLDFGSVPVGRTARRSVTVKNVGTAILTVTRVHTDLQVYEVINENTFTVEPAAAHIVVVEYKPRLQATNHAKLTFLSNDPQQPEASVALTGTGTSCFVVTAAYGSSMEREIRTLRNLRDRWLIHFGWGRALVNLYYRWNDSAVDFIARSRIGRIVTRWMLWPWVGLAHLVLSLHPIGKAIPDKNQLRAAAYVRDSPVVESPYCPYYT